jgi:hypothetical protein
MNRACIAPPRARPNQLPVYSPSETRIDDNCVFYIEPFEDVICRGQQLTSLPHLKVPAAGIVAFAWRENPAVVQALYPPFGRERRYGR